MLDILEQSDTRAVAGVARKLGLDSKSRRRDGNSLVLDTERRVSKARRINKALSMELTVACLLASLDHPRVVESYCATNNAGRPHYFAPALKPDISVAPESGEFRIVCEVSANRAINADTFLRQLEGALKHCVDAGRKFRGGVTYGLLVNHAGIAHAATFQRVYRGFVARKRLKPTSRVRLVPIRTGDLSTIARRLEALGLWSFGSVLFAKGLDVLHDRLHADARPGANNKEWMVDAFVEAVVEGVRTADDLFGSDADASEPRASRGADGSPKQ